MTAAATTTDLASLDEAELAALDAWWRADNYLTIGQIYLKDNALLARLRNPPGPDKSDGLTAREREILDLIADGCTNRQIAEQLFLAEKTVKNYVSALLAKLGMQRRTQAAVYGSQRRRPR